MNLRNPSLHKIFLQIFFFIFISHNSIRAQSAVFDSVYKKEAISFYGSSFMRGGIRLTNTQIKPLLLHYESSACQYKLYQKKLKVGMVFYFGALIMDGIALAMLGNSSDEKATAPLAMLGGSIVTMCISVPLLSKSQKHFQNSVFEYNREVLGERLYPR